MQTEAFFTDIRTVLLREIGLAKQSIHVAVAWFTDHTLFAALLARQRAGVPVALCLTRDDKAINFQPGGLPFAKLEAAGGRVFMVEDRLMHHKFCILDGRSSATSSRPTTASRPRPQPPTPSPSTPRAAPPSKSFTAKPPSAATPTAWPRPIKPPPPRRFSRCWAPTSARTWPRWRRSCSTCGAEFSPPLLPPALHWRY